MIVLNNSHCPVTGPVFARNFAAFMHYHSVDMSVGGHLKGIDDGINH